MSREILFRGKDESGILNHSWQFGALDNTDEKFPKIIRLDRWGNKMIVGVAPETVGQFTGLTDKNGKKIFEGDIVRADDYIFSIKYGKCGGTPNADNYGYMGFYLEAVSEGTKLCAKYGLRDDICYFTDISVIGNIHDNPELWKGGE